MIVLAALATFACTPTAVDDGDGPFGARKGRRSASPTSAPVNWTANASPAIRAPRRRKIAARDALMDLPGVARHLARLARPG